MQRRTVVAALAAASLFAVPTVAQAATKTVLLGAPAATQKALQKVPADANAFFPNTIAIHVGDSLKLVPAGFHNADFPARGQKFQPLFVPSGDKIAGENDAAGQPFWFNGLDKFAVSPTLMQPLYGKSASYNGSKRLNTGLPLGEKLKPATVKFTKKGTFTFFCDIHPGMKGTVQVKAKRAKIASKKADAKAVAHQSASVIKIAKRVINTTPASGNVNVGQSGPGGVEVFAFLPGTKTVHVGDTLRFKMSTGYDTHTATTGPGDPNDSNSYLGQLAAAYQGESLPGQASYASDSPSAPTATLTPQLHGNGFWSTGAMDSSSATPLPPSGAVTFGAPGSYSFYCLIHPFMKTTITVQ